MSAPACRTCGCPSPQFVGNLPDVAEFAGRRLDKALPGGRLWRCLECGFLFRDPLLDQTTYDDLYRNGAPGLWDEERREDFRLIRDLLKDNAASHRNIVDIGCYTGQLLASLPASFRLFGVEPSVEAARIATQRGVTIVAETVAQLLTMDVSYDVITACDVIEHVPDPLRFLTDLSGKLTAGGYIIITTGNCDSVLWRILGANYWYSHFPEHISFIGSKWVRETTKRSQLALTRFTPFNYAGGGLHLKRLVAVAAHQLSPKLYRRLRGRSGELGSEDVPPGSGATKDHMLCVFEVAKAV